MNRIEPGFITATCGHNDRFGAQSKDMSLSELLSLIIPIANPSTYVFPDFTMLIHRMDEQIRQKTGQSREDKMEADYAILFNTWKATSNITNYDAGILNWMKVKEYSLEYIVKAQRRLQKKLPTLLPCKYDLANEISSKGKMYCAAMLFYIIASSKIEPSSLKNDVCLRDCCSWFRNWACGYIDEGILKNLMLYAAIENLELYPALEMISGEARCQDVLVADFLRKQNFKPIELSWRIKEYNSTIYSATLELACYPEVYWHLVGTLRDHIYRVNQLEKFITQLKIHGSGVDYDRTNETKQWMRLQLVALDSAGKVEST